MRKLLVITLLLSAVMLQQASAFAMPDGKNKKKKDKESKQPVTNLNGEARKKLEGAFMEAEKAKVLGDWDEAVKKYQDVLLMDPSIADVHFQLAQIYFNQGRLQDAEKEAVTAAKADATNNWYLELLATLYMNTGKMKDAVETFKTLVEKFPNNPDYYLNLAFLYAKQGQLEQALKVYDQFEKGFGLDEQVVDEKKNIYLHLGKFNEAVNEVKKLQDEFPGETEYLLQEAELYRANKMKDKAMEVYKKVLAIEPDNPQAQIAIAGLSVGPANPEQKKENLREIFENPKVSIDTKVSILLISYIQMNSEDSVKRAEGIELAKILARVHPGEAKAYAVNGDLLYIDNQNEEALAAYKKALDLNPDVFEVWYQVMMIYNQQRDWANMLQTANSAMELFPNQAAIYLFKGNAEKQLKEYDKAVRSYQKGEKMGADNLKLRAQILANLGDVFHSLNRNAESDSSYEKSLKLDPDNAYVLNNYSYYLSLRKENLERAKQMSAYSNKLDPGNDSFLDTYAWILFQLNDYSGAREWIEKALKSGGDKSATILEHYGDVLYQLGSKEEALSYWKKAKDTGSDSPTLEKKISAQKYVEQ